MGDAASCFGDDDKKSRPCECLDRESGGHDDTAEAHRINASHGSGSDKRAFDDHPAATVANRRNALNGSGSDKRAFDDHRTAAAATAASIVSASAQSPAGDIIGNAVNRKELHDGSDPETAAREKALSRLERAMKMNNLQELADAVVAAELAHVGKEAKEERATLAQARQILRKKQALRQQQVSRWTKDGN